MISDMTEERKKELAERIISLSQKRIVEDAPALLMAVYALNPREKEEKEQISTDGTFFYYHPEQIIADILSGIDAGKPHAVIKDRREAVKYAIENFGEESVVLFAGKGHEKYEIIGQEKRFFDEEQIIREAVREKLMNPDEKQ